EYRPGGPVHRRPSAVAPPVTAERVWLSPRSRPLTALTSPQVRAVLVFLPVRPSHARVWVAPGRHGVTVGGEPLPARVRIRRSTVRWAAGAGGCGRPGRDPSGAPGRRGDGHHPSPLPLTSRIAPTTA